MPTSVKSKSKRSFGKRFPFLTKVAAITAVALVTIGAGIGGGTWLMICSDNRCPSIDVLDEYTPTQTSKLFAADGRFIAELGMERRTLVTLEEIPQVVQDAFVTTEDKRFYNHNGVDYLRVIGAGLRNIQSGRYAQGFSTITMQLARNVFPEKLSREKTLIRKLQETKVALAIEAKYPKKKILELYLNQIALGNGSYGVETASQRYFGKSVRDVNLAEAATLAALPKAPTRYNPRRYPDRAIQRRNTIVELMRSNDVISNEEASLAKAYPLRLASKVESGETAPYFVEWIRQLLDAQFGRQLYEGGLNVYTTLDLDLQTAAERALERQIRSIESGKQRPYSHITYEQYIARSASGETSGESSPYLQGSFVAVDPRTGGIRALVGGRDYHDSKFNRATQGMRQPGSTFKPLVYAAAIQNGLTASTLIDDGPISIAQADGSRWEPKNYDHKNLGMMTMRRGLYMSRNMVAINAGLQLGTRAVINQARNFGITTPIPPYPSIFIGSADVHPVEMVASYVPFANGGVRSQTNAILRVENSKGQVIWRPQPRKTQVMSPEEAWIMVSMMKDVVQRGTAYNSVWNAGFKYPAGGKTGTTNDGTDVWFVGFTSDLVAGVWIGFDKPKTIMRNAQGGQLAAPAWTTFMTEVYLRKPAPSDWPRPETVSTRLIDSFTGLLFTPSCAGPAIITEFYVPGTEPTQECGVFYQQGMPSIKSPNADSAAQ